MAQVAANVGVAGKTVRAIARRYEEEGLESALYEKPRPGKHQALDAGQSQRIIGEFLAGVRSSETVPLFDPVMPVLDSLFVD